MMYFNFTYLKLTHTQLRTIERIVKTGLQRALTVNEKNPMSLVVKALYHRRFNYCAVVVTRTDNKEFTKKQIKTLEDCKTGFYMGFRYIVNSAAKMIY